MSEVGRVTKIKENRIRCQEEINGLDSTYLSVKCTCLYPFICSISYPWAFQSSQELMKGNKCNSCSNENFALVWYSKACVTIYTVIQTSDLLARNDDKQCDHAWPSTENQAAYPVPRILCF